jgi:hypothetical protein
MRATALIALTLIGGCGKKRTTVVVGPTGPAGSSCSVVQLSGAAKIVCDDGSEALVSDGAQGSDGSDGADGSSCSVGEVHDGYLVECTDGTAAFIPKKGGKK